MPKKWWHNSFILKYKKKCDSAVYEERLCSENTTFYPLLLPVRIEGIRPNNYPDLWAAL